MRPGGDKIRLVFRNFCVVGGKSFAGATRLEAGRPLKTT